MDNEGLPTSIRRIVKAIEEADDLTLQKLKRIVVAANVSQDDLLPWAAYDHRPSDSYGRQLVYDGGWFEIMAMSWECGDFSAIHDHGHTAWGAVQVFGPAEHSVCTFDAEQFYTISRATLVPGRVIGVNHDIVHQMGNPSDTRFMSLHVYGNTDRESAITADARVFDLTKGEVLWTDGGVFYSLGKEDINRRTPCPKPDYYTWLFDLQQRIARDRRAGAPVRELLAELSDVSHWESFKADLLTRIDERGAVTDSRYWRWLCDALKSAACLQDELDRNGTGDERNSDTWRTYANYYDHVIGTTNSYIPSYLKKVFLHYSVDPTNVSFVDVGCGTGWLEAEIVKRFEMNPQKILGVDPSPAMLAVAATRTNVRQAGLLDIGKGFESFDISFCNSFQYLPHEDFDTAVENMFAVTKPGGLCIGEFISQDHIRWYPNVVFSENDLVVSLRTPSFRERGGHAYQENEIINVSRLDKMRITHEGIHRRLMVSPRRVRDSFRKAFGDEIKMFDAVSFDEIPESSETCASTRYLICARHAKSSSRK